MSKAPDLLPTTRFVGKRLQPEDLEDFQDFYADPAVMATLSADGRVWPRSESEELFRRHMEHWEEHGFGTWIFREGECGPFVARAGLRQVDVGSGPEVELFYGVASSRWGQGIATEVGRTIVEAAFDHVRLAGLVGFTLPTNHASQRVMQKCGFHRSGEITHAGLEHYLFRLNAQES